MGWSLLLTASTTEMRPCPDPSHPACTQAPRTGTRGEAHAEAGASTHQSHSVLHQRHYVPTRMIHPDSARISLWCTKRPSSSRACGMDAAGQGTGSMSWWQGAAKGFYCPMPCSACRVMAQQGRHRMCCSSRPSKWCFMLS